jgi:hypothetical protein
MKEFIMKRKLACIAVMILGFCFSAALRADIISPDTNLVQNCIKIVNTADFPDFTVIAVVNAYGGSKIVKTYVVKPDQCLEKGYKFNGLLIVAVQQEDSKEQGLDNLPLAPLINDWVKNKKLPDAASPFQLLSAALKPEAISVSRSDPLRSVVSEYKLALQDGSLKLALARKTETFRDGKSRITNY